VARPLFLLSNDDGYRAPGLSALRAALLEHGEVVVCAPETEQRAERLESRAFAAPPSAPS
jgi:5'-nucleotidase